MEITQTGIRADMMMGRLNKRLFEGVAKAIAKSGALVARTAKQYAPVSPTQKQINASLKRKKRSKRRAMPGGLEKSIMFDYTTLETWIYVPSTAPAAAYARKIHDQRGVSWRYLGVGSISKGAQAREKFIERALVDNIPNINKLFDKAFEEAMKNE